MITTQTPFRISFFGGGSDIGSFYSRHPGAVLSVAINRSMYLTTHPYFDLSAIHLKYSKTELVPSVDQIEHPILRAVLRELVPKGGIEVASIADIPGGTGLGSSSAFTVGLIQNLNARVQRFLPPGRLAEDACRIVFKALLMKDPDFLADAKKQKLDVAPMDGEQLSALVKKIYATPKPIVDKVSELIK